MTEKPGFYNNKGEEKEPDFREQFLKNIDDEKLRGYIEEILARFPKYPSKSQLADMAMIIEVYTETYEEIEGVQEKQRSFDQLMNALERAYLEPEERELNPDEKALFNQSFEVAISSASEEKRTKIKTTILDPETKLLFFSRYQKLEEIPENSVKHPDREEMLNHYGLSNENITDNQNTKSTIYQDSYDKKVIEMQTGSTPTNTEEYLLKRVELKIEGGEVWMAEFLEKQ